jgi:Ca2+-binding RTX toxin-like protein
MLCRRPIAPGFAIAIALVALVALATAPAALAASAEVSGTTVIYDVDLPNPFAQDLLIEFKDGRYVFTERGSEKRVLLNAKTGCTKGDGKVLSCNGTGITKVTVSTENFDDVVLVGDGVTVPVEFTMGQGGDQATGGPAADIFRGGSLGGLGNDTFEGLGGDDTFFAGPNADLMKGGDGSDTVNYSDRSLRQAVSLDDEANDGDPFDLASLDSAALSGADNAQQIENIVGGTAKDTLIGNDSANKLDGGNAADTLEGRGGPDTLIGGNGNDEILARSAAGGVADPDTLISCGGGQDTVTADPEDGPAIAADCEDIDCGGCDLPPAGSPPGTPAQSPEIAAIDPPGGANDQDEGTGPGGSGSGADPDGDGPEQAPKAQAPRVQIVSSGVVPLKSNGRIPVRIFCIYRADRCGGSLTLKTTAKIKVKIGRKTRTFAKNKTISTEDLAPIRWGNSEPVQMKASPLFRAILPLLRKPNTKVKAILVSRDIAGGADAPEARATGDLTVAAKPKRKGK